jgi:DNA-binding NarL/FixJ family response regulator
MSSCLPAPELPARMRLMMTDHRGRAQRQRAFLSQREAEVLRLVARGLTNNQIARELGVSLSTVKAHLSSILAKLSLPTRTQLALYAARTGLVGLEGHELWTDDGHATSAS